MRGAEGIEKSIRYADFWGSARTRTGHIQEDITRTFASLVAAFPGVPTLYSRFTFTVRHVREILSAGSPKIIRVKKGKVTAWFFSSGLAFHLEGAKHQTEKALDTITKTIRDSDDGAQFFLEFVTCRAYQVRA